MRLAEGEQLIERLLEVDRRLTEIVLQHEIVEIQHLAQLRREAVALEEIGHAHGTPRHLVLVGRPDAAARGADGVGSARLLARFVQQDVRGQDERAVRRDAQPVEHGHALLHQHAALREQRLQRQHHAVADEAADVLAEDAGGNQGQDGLAAADDQRVPGVVSALEARDRGGALRQQIDDLALALIAPLGADDDDEFTHSLCSDD